MNSATSDEVLKPGIHSLFCYAPHQNDVKCLTHSGKRFVSSDDSGNVAIWVRLLAA